MNKSKKPSEQPTQNFLGLPMRWDHKNAFKNLWNKNDEQIFPPKHFGIGWSLNFHALLKSTGVLNPKVRDLNSLPSDLPVPQDDGACDHLSQLAIPRIILPSTVDRKIDLQKQSQKPTILFFYPRTGEPSMPAPEDWDLIPGARGCTPQSCGFRDLNSEFKELGFEIFGVSSQNSEYQKEFVKRNHIPFEILSDEEFKLTDAINLPTFQYNEMRLIKRMALVLKDGKIVKVFYPVFPPNKNAETVLSWIQKQRKSNEHTNI
ncbi:MAG: redoxin family protein [Pseudobdellovibrionaceae bacterium]